MERPQHTNRGREAAFHPHYFTRTTPHVRIDDGYARPYRPAGSWYEIENQIGWAERQHGQGGGLGSDRHTDRLINGIGWAGAFALVLIPGLAFPPWLVIGGILLILSAIASGIDALAADEDRYQAEQATAAAYAAQMPHPHPRIDSAFSSPNPHYRPRGHQ